MKKKKNQNRKVRNWCISLYQHHNHQSKSRAFRVWPISVSGFQRSTSTLAVVHFPANGIYDSLTQTHANEMKGLTLFSRKTRTYTSHITTHLSVVPLPVTHKIKTHASSFIKRNTHTKTTSNQAVLQNCQTRLSCELKNKNKQQQKSKTSTVKQTTYRVLH